MAAAVAVTAKASVSLSEELIVAKVAQKDGGNVRNVVVTAFLGALDNEREGGRMATVETGMRKRQEMIMTIQVDG